MTSTRELRDLLSAGRRDELLGALVAIDAPRRRALSKPLVARARAILSVQFGSTVSRWLRSLRKDYPGGYAQFIDAWEGSITTGHWDAATTVLLAARTSAQAAKVWPIPTGSGFAEALYPALFPGDLSIFCEQWSADYWSNPKHWDRNAGRGVMYEWVEAGLVEPPRHDGAVLMLFSGLTAEPGRPLLRWLLARPQVTSHLFTRIFVTPGVSGASLAQRDLPPHSDSSLREVVVPGLVRAGLWTHEFVVHGAQSALRSDLPAYQKRWFEGVASDFGSA
ncbi:hypothetical protein [Microbacterium sp. C7(2022)]|uniref:hypothetical protein n=1 Tax=Microbacterium sp. C7(2022) TaxID=2992759 RepID=UPI00237BF74B|nr:hypothetical protein [Microbacterium sp. C7(2022)]MDE0545750.1 hypothetical protein [Microbacterium sp. C7(2022)]